LADRQRPCGWAGRPCRRGSGRRMDWSRPAGGNRRGKVRLRWRCPRRRRYGWRTLGDDGAARQSQQQCRPQPPLRAAHAASSVSTNIQLGSAAPT
jgi:hypothetical protein